MQSDWSILDSPLSCRLTIYCFIRFIICYVLVELSLENHSFYTVFIWNFLYYTLYCLSRCLSLVRNGARSDVISSVSAVETSTPVARDRTELFSRSQYYYSRETTRVIIIIIFIVYISKKIINLILSPVF